MSSVIVMGANYSSALGVVRALGVAGYDVKLLSLNKNTHRIAGSSKYVKKSIRTGRSYQEIKKGLDALNQVSEKTMVIPADDISCRLLSLNDEELLKHYYIPNVKMHPGELARFMSKYEQKKLAEICNVATAKGKAYNTDLCGKTEALQEAVFPCFVKPLGDESASKNLMGCCNNSEELNNKIKNANNNGCNKVLIEKYLPIDKEYCLCGVAYNGQAIIPAVIDKIHVGCGAYKGVTAEAYVKSADELINDVSKLEQFVGAMGFSGLFDIELIESEGIRYFCEMNMRNSAAGYGITAAGVNLPAALVKATLNNTPLDCMKVKKPIHFISEKVALDDFTAGFLSWTDYKERVNSSYVHFIRNEDDTKPYRAYQFIVLRKRILAKLRKKHSNILKQC